MTSQEALGALLFFVLAVILLVAAAILRVSRRGGLTPSERLRARMYEPRPRTAIRNARDERKGKRDTRGEAVP